MVTISMGVGVVRSKIPLSTGDVSLGAFGVNFIIIGYIRSFGLLFVAFQEKYGYSAGLVSLVTGVQNIAFCLVSFITMNFFLKKISIRTSCIVGILLMSSAVALSDLVPNSVYLILCLGLLFGIGQALVMFPLLLIVAEYFLHRRSIAVAIASCGSSLGGVTFPFITKALLDRYGLQGAVLIIAGLLLHQLLFVIVFTPPSEYGYERKNNDDFFQNAVPDSDAQGCLLNGDDGQRFIYKDINLYGSYELVLVGDETGSLPSKSLGDADIDFSKELVYHHSPKSQGVHQHNPAVRETCAEGNHDVEQMCQRYESRNGVDVNLSPGKSFLENSINALAASAPSLQVASESKPTISVSTVIRSKMFWALLPYFLGSPVGSACPSIFIPPLVKERGLGDDIGAFFLTISAAVDTVGRIVPGIVLQLGLMTPTRLAIIPMAIGCVMYCVTFALHDYTGLLILTLVYGVISSSYFVIQTLVVIETLGMTRLASAMGYYALVSGFALGVSFPMGGFLHDVTGTFSASFIYFAAMFFLGILSIIAVQVLKQREARQLKDT